MQVTTAVLKYSDRWWNPVAVLKHGVLKIFNADLQNANT